MTKLSKKLFLVLTSILTFTLFSILFIFNYQDYQREYKSIESILKRTNIIPKKNDEEFSRINSNQVDDVPSEPKSNTERKIFVDSIVYTVTIKDNQVKNIVNHTENDLIEAEITKIANNILTKEENYKIGNLYFEKYSYSKKENILTIVDNKIVRERLLSNLTTSLIIFISIEIIIILISLKLTKWLIKPVDESFQKQKQFIEDASHELKTPITVILANAEMIEPTKDNKKWLDNIKSETERMSKLVYDLLSLARLEKDSQEFTTINLSNLLEKAILPLESLMFENDIKLEYHLDDSINYSCHPDQIKQLLVILLDNAIKHSTKKGKIIVNLKNIKNEIIIEVKNKGKAIPQSDYERIFERFYRGDSSRNRDSNRYGLGLAIAKKIVLNHNGKISVSCADGYTTFKIVFKQG